MIDCGLDWLGKFEKLQPDAIVLTHAHPDHAWGLKNCLRPNGIDFAFMFSVVATALCRRFEATSQ